MKTNFVGLPGLACDRAVWEPQSQSMLAGMDIEN